MSDNVPLIGHVNSITLKDDKISKAIVSEIKITQYQPVSLILDDVKFFPTKAIWDTGASGSVITQEVVDALNLKPTGQARVWTASESGIIRPTYGITLKINNDLPFSIEEAVLGKIAHGIGCLIGMDVISKGDFSITNFENKTCMSFRSPSQHEIDYENYK
jgi:predicted aspartyl protease